MIRINLVLLLVGTSFLVLAGCRRTPPSKPLSELTPTERQGRAVFESDCAMCHSAHTGKSRHGPGLQGMFKKPYLPSGAPANDERVMATILHGRGMMPAFGNELDEPQQQSLLAYLHTL